MGCSNQALEKRPRGSCMCLAGQQMELLVYEFCLLCRHCLTLRPLSMPDESESEPCFSHKKICGGWFHWFSGGIEVEVVFSLFTSFVSS
ncbi:hypothetical protein SOVF_165440 [Spinacia oleracea]|nr:hypothetical protein SOVF_165440 [Spinacia oleracea]